MFSRNSNNLLNKPIALSNVFWIILVLILLVGNAFFGVKYSAVKKDIKLTQTALDTRKINEKVLDFTKFFIEEVLKAETEVDFETRLQLENAVRSLNDEEILTNWQRFIDSKTEAEAQEQVKNLLEMLVSKIKTW